MLPDCSCVSLFLDIPLESKCLIFFFFWLLLQGVCFDIPVDELSNIQVCFCSQNCLWNLVIFSLVGAMYTID